MKLPDYNTLVKYRTRKENLAKKIETGTTTVNDVRELDYLLNQVTHMVIQSYKDNNLEENDILENSVRRVLWT